MRVPYQLYWRPAASASALLYPGDVAGLLRLCTRIGGANLPHIHAVSEGFLVVLDAPSNAVFPGVIRLRALAEGVYLPVDAGLSPALLPEEARALGARQGVVFLPGGQVLAFDRETRLGPRELLQVPTLPRRAWRPPPARPDRVHELTSIVLDLPPEDVLGRAGEDIGAETPRAPKTGPMAEASAGIKSGLGRALDKLGEWLGSDRLRAVAAGLLRKAMEQAPRLTEKLLGKHESALRDLLRRFREGNLDDALRHAVPLNNEPGRGGTIDDDPRLVRRDFRWTSADLNARDGGSAWLSSDELFAQLREQYRRAADVAEAKGDFLRAAAIHGKLLGDWRRAASLLERAGRPHDAALVYLEKLGDKIAAARAFEAAGEIDRAVDLYLAEGRPLEAADLLRRVGEEDRAMRHYLDAAWAEANRGNFALAARLMATRAGAPALAEPFLVRGWEGRPSIDANECLHDLAGVYVARTDPAALTTLLDEADAYFAAPGDDAAASRFYNRLISRSPTRDDLRDRALRGLAGKLRQRADEGDHGVGVISLLFGQSAGWDAATVRDAEFALKATRPAVPAPRKGSRWIALHFATVTAVAQAAESGVLVLGFADGSVVRYDPASERVSRLTLHPEPVVSVSCSPDGEMIAVIRRQGEGYTLMAYQVHPDAWINIVLRALDVAEGCEPYLTPLIGYGNAMLGLQIEGKLHKILKGTGLTPHPTTTFHADILAAWFEPSSPFNVMGMGLWTLDAHRTLHAWRRKMTSDSVFVGSVSLPEQLASPSILSWNVDHHTDSQIAWRGEHGKACWVRLIHDKFALRLEDSQLWSVEQCLAVTLLDAGKLAAVHERGITWLRADGGSMRVLGQSETIIKDAIAAFASPKTGELLVVTKVGEVVRVPLPG